MDFNRRSDDKTNANILILGNSGQGKSYLLKLILCSLRESGMHILALDPEMEYEDLTLNLGGCFIDLMGGEFIINVLEPKSWDEQTEPVLNPHTKTAYQLSQGFFPRLQGFHRPGNRYYRDHAGQALRQMGHHRPQQF